MGGLYGGATWIAQHITPRKAHAYLCVLEKFIYIAVGIPAVFMGMGFILYWVSRYQSVGLIEPLWRISVLIGGGFALLFGVALAIFAGPIGTLISAATVAPKSPTPATATTSLKWYQWFSPIGVLQEIPGIGAGLMQELRKAIERYLDAVRMVLVVTSFGFFFFAALPRPDVTLLLLFTMGAAAIWFNRAYSGIWAYAAQAGALVVMAIYGFKYFFPKITPVKHYLRQPPEELTLTEVDAKTKVVWNWVNTNYQSPAFITLAIVFLVVLVVTVLLVRKALASYTTTTSTPAAGDAHAAPAVAVASGHGGHDHGGHDAHGGGGKPMHWFTMTVIGAFAALLVIYLITNIFESWHIAKATERRQLLEELERVAARSVAPAQVVSNGRSARVETSIQATAPVDMAVPSLTAVGRLGLKNPKGYKLDITSGKFSLGVPLPKGMHIRVDPEDFPVKIRVNGLDWEHTPNEESILPDDVRFLQYKWRSMDTSLTNIVVWVGPKA